MVNVERQTWLNSIAQITAQLIIKNNGELPYDLIDCVLKESWDEITNDYDKKVSLLLFMSMIAKHIPYPNMSIRPDNKSWEGAVMFMHSHNEEERIVNYSWDLDKHLTELKFNDTTHNTFHAGAGNGNPDLVDNFGNTYEVKYNYMEKGSISNLHNPDYLIDCVPYKGIYIYRFYKGAKVEVDPVIYNDIEFIRRISNWAPEFLKAEDKNLLITGELIPMIDTILTQNNFIWNK